MPIPPPHPLCQGCPDTDQRQGGGTDPNQEPRVLVVDDEADIRAIVGLNLRFAGIDSDEAGNGNEALEKLRAAPFDGLILDLAMPEKDGYAVLEAMAAENGLRDVAVIVLSARGSPAAAIKALIRGAHAHIVKPFSPPFIAQAMQTLIELPREDRNDQRLRMIERADALDRLGVPTV